MKKKRRLKKTPPKASPLKRLLRRLPHSVLAMSVVTVGMILAVASLAGAAPKSIDANTLDGLDSTDFLGANAKAVDADKLDGMDSSYFKPLTVGVAADGTLTDWPNLEHPYVLQVLHPKTGVYVVQFDRNVSQRARFATLGRADGAYFEVDSPYYDPDDFGPNSPYLGHVFTENVYRENDYQEDEIAVFTFNLSGELADRDFQLIVFPEETVFPPGS